MARSASPSRMGEMSEAFRERSRKEREKLRTSLAEQLAWDMMRLYEEAQNVDTQFLVSGVQFPAHRAVLRARLPQLSDRFLPTHVPGTVTVVPVFKHVKHDEFKDLLLSVYTGEDLAPCREKLQRWIDLYGSTDSIREASLSVISEIDEEVAVDSAPDIPDENANPADARLPDGSNARLPDGSDARLPDGSDSGISPEGCAALHAGTVEVKHDGIAPPVNGNLADHSESQSDLEDDDSSSTATYSSEDSSESGSYNIEDGAGHSSDPSLEGGAGKKHDVAGSIILEEEEEEEEGGWEDQRHMGTKACEIQTAADSGTDCKSVDSLQLHRGPPSPASVLAADLLQLFVDCVEPDIEIVVENQKIKAHRAILCARSGYFSAMLSGSWAESMSQEITLHGVSHSGVLALLYFIYGGTMDLPDNVTPSEVVPLADMYGLEGLKDVAALILKHNNCHLFHKPCTGCLTAVPDCLSLAHTFGMEGLYTGCLKWISKHFAKVWPTQTFANLPTQLMHKCFTAIQETLTNENAVAMAIESDKLQSTIPALKWAEPVRDLSLQLRDACVVFIVENFGPVVENGTFCTLLRGMGWKGQFVNQVFTAVVDSLNPDNCCGKFLSVNRLKQLAGTDDWNSDMVVQVNTTHERTWSYLVQNVAQVQHSAGWNILPAHTKTKVKEAAVFVDDVGHVPAKKPKLSSAQRAKKAASRDRQPASRQGGKAEAAALKAPTKPKKSANPRKLESRKSRPSSGSHPSSGSAGSRGEEHANVAMANGVRPKSAAKSKRPTSGTRTGKKRTSSKSKAGKRREASDDRRESADGRRDVMDGAGLMEGDEQVEKGDRMKLDEPSRTRSPTRKPRAPFIKQTRTSSLRSSSAGSNPTRPRSRSRESSLTRVSASSSKSDDMNLDAAKGKTATKKSLKKKRLSSRSRSRSPAVVVKEGEGGVLPGYMRPRSRTRSPRPGAGFSDRDIRSSSSTDSVTEGKPPKKKKSPKIKPDSHLLCPTLAFQQKSRSFVLSEDEMDSAAAKKSPPAKQLSSLETSPTRRPDGRDNSPARQPAGSRPDGRQLSNLETSPTRRPDGRDSSPARQPASLETSPAKKSGSGQASPAKKSASAEASPAKKSSTTEASPVKKSSSTEASPAKKLSHTNTSPAKKPGSPNKKPASPSKRVVVETNVKKTKHSGRPSTPKKAAPNPAENVTKARSPKKVGMRREKDVSKATQRDKNVRKEEPAGAEVPAEEAGVSEKAETEESEKEIESARENSMDRGSDRRVTSIDEKPAPADRENNVEQGSGRRVVGIDEKPALADRENNIERDNDRRAAGIEETPADMENTVELDNDRRPVDINEIPAHVDREGSDLLSGTAAEIHRAPDTQPTVPDTEQTVPDTEPTVPDTEPTVPDTQPTIPDTEHTVQYPQPMVPGTQPMVQESQPVEPESQPVEPESQPVAPCMRSEQSVVTGGADAQVSGLDVSPPAVPTVDTQQDEDVSNSRLTRKENPTRKKDSSRPATAEKTSSRSAATEKTGRKDKHVANGSKSAKRDTTTKKDNIVKTKATVPSGKLVAKKSTREISKAPTATAVKQGKAKPKGTETKKAENTTDETKTKARVPSAARSKVTAVDGKVKMDGKVKLSVSQKDKVTTATSKQADKVTAAIKQADKVTTVASKVTATSKHAAGKKSVKEQTKVAVQGKKVAEVTTVAKQQVKTSTKDRNTSDAAPAKRVGEKPAQKAPADKPAVGEKPAKKASAADKPARKKVSAPDKQPVKKAPADKLASRKTTVPAKVSATPREAKGPKGLSKKPQKKQAGTKVQKTAVSVSKTFQDSREEGIPDKPVETKGMEAEKPPPPQVNISTEELVCVTRNHVSVAGPMDLKPAATQDLKPASTHEPMELKPAPTQGQEPLMDITVQKTVAGMAAVASAEEDMYKPTQDGSEQVSETHTQPNRIDADSAEHHVAAAHVGSVETKHEVDSYVPSQQSDQEPVVVIKPTAMVPEAAVEVTEGVAPIGVKESDEDKTKTQTPSTAETAQAETSLTEEKEETTLTAEALSRLETPLTAAETPTPSTTETPPLADAIETPPSVEAKETPPPTKAETTPSVEAIETPPSPKAETPPSPEAVTPPSGESETPTPPTAEAVSSSASEEEDVFAEDAADLTAPSLLDQPDSDKPVPPPSPPPCESPPSPPPSESPPSPPPTPASDTEEAGYLRAVPPVSVDAAVSLLEAEIAQSTQMEETAPVELQGDTQMVETAPVELQGDTQLVEMAPVLLQGETQVEETEAEIGEDRGAQPLTESSPAEQQDIPVVSDRLETTKQLPGEDGEPEAALQTVMAEPVTIRAARSGLLPTIITMAEQQEEYSVPGVGEKAAVDQEQGRSKANVAEQTAVRMHITESLGGQAGEIDRSSSTPEPAVGPESADSTPGGERVLDITAAVRTSPDKSQEPAATLDMQQSLSEQLDVRVHVEREHVVAYEVEPAAPVDEQTQQLRSQTGWEGPAAASQQREGPPAEVSDEELFVPRSLDTKAVQQPAGGMSDFPGDVSAVPGDVSALPGASSIPDVAEARPELVRAESDILSDRETVEEDEEEKAVEADDEMSSVMSSEAGTEEKPDTEDPQRLAEMDASWEYTNSFVYHTSGIRSLSDSHTDRTDDTADDFSSKLLLRSESEPWTRAAPSEEDLTPTVVPEDIPYKAEDVPYVPGDVPYMHEDVPYVPGDVPYVPGDVPYKPGDVPYKHEDVPYVPQDVPYKDSVEADSSPDTTPVTAKDFLQGKVEPRRAYEEPAGTKRSERPKAPLRSLSMGQPPETPVKYDSKYEGSKYGTSWDLRSASIESFEEESTSFMTRSLDSAQLEDILDDPGSPDAGRVQEAPDGLFSQPNGQQTHGQGPAIGSTQHGQQPALGSTQKTEPTSPDQTPTETLQRIAERAGKAGQSHGDKLSREQSRHLPDTSQTQSAQRHTEREPGPADGRRPELHQLRALPAVPEELSMKNKQEHDTKYEQFESGCGRNKETVCTQLEITVMSELDTESDQRESPESTDPKESPDPRDSPESEGSPKDSLKESDSSGGASGGSPEIDSGFVFVSAADIPKELHGLNISFPRGRPPMLQVKEAEPECGTGVEDLLAEHLSDVSGQESDAEFDQVAELMSPESPLPMFTNLPGVSEFVPEAAIEESMPEPSDTLDPHAHFTEAGFPLDPHSRFTDAAFPRDPHSHFSEAGRAKCEPDIFSCRPSESVSASQIHEDMVVIDSPGPGRDVSVGMETQLMLDACPSVQPAADVMSEILSPPEEVVQNEANEGIESGQTFLRVDSRGTAERPAPEPAGSPGSLNPTAEEFVPKLGGVPDVVADVPGSHLNPEAQEFQPHSEATSAGETVPSCTPPAEQRVPSCSPPAEQRVSSSYNPPTEQRPPPCITPAPPSGERPPPSYTPAPPSRERPPPSYTPTPPAGERSPPSYTSHTPSGERPPPSYTPAPPGGERPPPSSTSAPGSGERVLPSYTAHQVMTNDTTVDEFVLNPGAPEFVPHPGTVEYIPMPLDEDRSPSPNDSETVLDYWTSETSGTIKRRPPIMCTSEGAMVEGGEDDMTPTAELSPGSVHRRSEVMTSGLLQGRSEVDGAPREFVRPEPLPDAIVDDCSPDTPVGEDIPGLTAPETKSAAEPRSDNRRSAQSSSSAEGRASGKGTSGETTKHVTFKLEDEICGYTETEMFEEIRISRKIDSDSDEPSKPSALTDVLEMGQVSDEEEDPTTASRPSPEESDEDSRQYKHVVLVSVSVCEKSLDSQLSEEAADEQNVPGKALDGHSQMPEEAAGDHRQLPESAGDQNQVTEDAVNRPDMPSGGGPDQSHQDSTGTDTDDSDGPPEGIYRVTPVDDLYSAVNSESADEEEEEAGPLEDGRKMEEARFNSAVDAKMSDSINGNVVANGHGEGSTHEGLADAENGNSASTDKEEDSCHGFRDFPVYETVTSFRFQANTIRKDPEGPDSESTYINGMYDFSLESAGAVRILPRHESAPYEPVVRSDVISTAARLSREEMQSEHLTTTTRMTREDIKFIDDDGEETHTTTFLSLRQQPTHPGPPRPQQPTHPGPRVLPKAGKFVRFAKKEEYVDIDDDDGDTEEQAGAEASPASTPSTEENLEITQEFDSLQHEPNNIEASELDRNSQDSDSEPVKVVVTASHAPCQPLSPVTVPVDGIVRAPLAHEEEDEDTENVEAGGVRNKGTPRGEIVVVAEVHQSSVDHEEQQSFIPELGCTGTAAEEGRNDTVAISSPEQHDEETAAEEDTAVMASPDQPQNGTAAISSPEQPDGGKAAEEGTAVMSSPDQPGEVTATEEGTAAVKGTAAASEEETAVVSSPEQPDEGTAAMSCSEDTEDEGRSPQSDKSKGYKEVVMGTYYSEGCILKIVKTRADSEDSQSDDQLQEDVQNQVQAATDGESSVTTLKGRSEQGEGGTFCDQEGNVDFVQKQSDRPENLTDRPDSLSDSQENLTDRPDSLSDRPTFVTFGKEADDAKEGEGLTG